LGRLKLAFVAAVQEIGTNDGFELTATASNHIKTGFLYVNRKMPWAVCGPFGIGCSGVTGQIYLLFCFVDFLPVIC